MSEQSTGVPKTTARQVIVALIGGFAAPIIAIVLIVQLVLSIQASHIDKDDPQLADLAVRERIKPVAEVKSVDPNAPRVERTGEQVYQAVCTSCHQAGALGAPKFGNKADWAPRIAQGYETLIKHAIEGIRGMPPRGGDPDISDIEIARTVAYMANSAGANFQPKE
ncbi:c-type cytochrome [Thiobacter aerophilum]|uniref:C-type cytochrome n=1 Tax=Thiobacter aerophilum TaxID=3121275 RepID=A0ABV0EEB0_9BURK